MDSLLRLVSLTYQCTFKIASCLLCLGSWFLFGVNKYHIICMDHRLFSYFLNYALATFTFPQIVVKLSCRVLCRQFSMDVVEIHELSCRLWIISCFPRWICSFIPPDSEQRMTLPNIQGLGHFMLHLINSHFQTF